MGGVANEVKIFNENSFGKQKKWVAKMKDKIFEHFEKKTKNRKDEYENTKSKSS